MRTSHALGLTALAGLVLASSSSHAAEFNIANRDVAGLIRALQTAGSNDEADVIHLAAGGIYTLEMTDSRGLALPTLRGAITLEGHGAEVRRYTGVPMRFFEIAERAEVTILDLGIAEASMGAIANAGVARLERITITDSDNLPGVTHAIVHNSGELAVRDSLIGFNRVRGVASDGGVVINEGRLDLFNTRFTANEVVRVSTDALAAGAVLNRGELSVENALFEDNTIGNPDGEYLASAVVEAR